MNNDNVFYAPSDAGLNQFFAKIYGLVGLGIALSTFVSYLMLFVFPSVMVDIIYNHHFVYFASLILEFILVVSASSAARKNTPAALPLFLLYSALNGFTMTFIIITYTQSVVIQAFLSSAILFFVMSGLGFIIKRDLSGIAKALMSALIGILLASIINLFFLRSGLMSYLISIVSVVIFSGLIAYDNQMIKRVYEKTGGEVKDGWAISMALSLYLDFINLFISILRIFGNKD